MYYTQLKPNNQCVSPVIYLLPLVCEGREVRCGQFWDVVALTAVDSSQRQAYELQVRDKVSRKELPLGIDYRVFSDPPGAKIGELRSTAPIGNNLKFVVCL